jgi:hypothetical protein
MHAPAERSAALPPLLSKHLVGHLKSKVNVRLASATWVLSSNSLVLAHTVKYYNQQASGRPDHCHPLHPLGRCSQSHCATAFQIGVIEVGLTVAVASRIALLLFKLLSKHQVG